MSNPFIGRRIQVLIGKESTYGTKASSFVEVPRSEGTDSPQQERAIDTSGIGRIETINQSHLMHSWGEPTISGIVTDKLFGHFLLSALGTSALSGDDPEAGVATHDFTVANNNNHPSYTLVYIYPGVVTKMVTGCRLNSLNLTSEQDFVKFTANFTGKKAEDTTETFSYSEENKFLPKHRVIKYADDISGLAAATDFSAKINSFSIDIEKNVENFFGGSESPHAIVNKNFGVSGSITELYDASEKRDVYESGTRKAFLIQFANTDATIGTSTNPLLQFQINRAHLQNWGDEAGLDDIVLQTYGFTGEYKAGDGAMITAKMINEKATNYNA